MRETKKKKLIRTVSTDEAASALLDLMPAPGNTKGGSTSVLLTSCLTGLESVV